METEHKKTVSYSQFSIYSACPKHFYLDYCKKLKKYDPNLNTSFGNAIHEVLQLYIKTLYTKGSTESDAIDLYKLFKEKFDQFVKEDNLTYTDDEYTGFVFDGEDILKYFITNRLKYFPSGKYEFIDVEMEIKEPLRQNVDIIAYIDLILKDKETGIIKIIDIKTSSNGWNTYQKTDEIKLSQLQIYKALYSKKFGIPLNKIQIEFFIVKRKLFENVNYPQSRIQIVEPPDKKRNIADTLNKFTEFIICCFDDNGNYKMEENIYPQTPGTNKKYCKYCAHKKVNCNAKESQIISNEL